MSSTAIWTVAVGVLVFILAVVGILSMTLGRKDDQTLGEVAAVWYTQAALAVGATVALAGVATLVKSIVGFISGSLSYSDPVSESSFSSSGPPANFSSIPNFGGPYIGQAREEDLIFSVFLIVIGILVIALHWRLRDVAGLRSEPTSWRAAATPMLTLGLWGVIGIGSLLEMVNGIISNIVTNPTANGATPTLVGDSIGTVVAFLPTWCWVVFRLFRQRAPQPS
jgi:hypothetical protein